MNPLKKLLKPASAKPAAAAPTPVSAPAKVPLAPVAPAPVAAPVAAKIAAAPHAPAKPASGLEGKPSAGPVVASITISQEAIAQAAYFRWQRCGGDEATNWRLAEQELREEAAKIGLKA